jgi:hypothetical protein
MGADWEVGDLALVVNDSPCSCGCDSPYMTKGRTFTVEGVVAVGEKTGLYLEGVTPPWPHHAFNAIRFRKILPDTHEGNADDWNLLTEQFGTKVTA